MVAESSPKTATALAREYPISRQGILKHLDVLQNAGLVRVKQHGREMRYWLTPEPLSELDLFIRQVETQWDQRLIRLKDFVESQDAGE